MDTHSSSSDSEPEVPVPDQPPCPKRRRVTKKPLLTDEEKTRTKKFLLTQFCLELVPSPHPYVAYCCYSRELCPTTQRPHYQMYVESNARFSVATICKQVPWLVGARYEKARGTLLENQLYCQKTRQVDIDSRLRNGPNSPPISEGYTEFGTPLPENGQHRKVKEMTDSIMSGDTTVEQIAVENPEAYHQYGRTLEKVQSIRLNEITRSGMTKCLWLYGPSGGGKSHLAHSLKFFLGRPYCKTATTWWSGYKQQKYVIFDEFRGELPYPEFLKMTDKYDYKVQVKCKDELPFTSELIVITCPARADQVYQPQYSWDTMAQIERRVLQVHVTEHNRADAMRVALDYILDIIPPEKRSVAQDYMAIDN